MDFRMKDIRYSFVYAAARSTVSGSVHSAVNHSERRAVSSSRHCAIKRSRHSTLTGKTHAAEHTCANGSTCRRSSFLTRYFTNRVFHRFAGMGVIILTFFIVAGAAACRKAESDEEAGTAAFKKKELTKHTLLVLGKEFDTHPAPFTYLTDFYTSESLQTHLHIVHYRDMIVQTKQPRLSYITEYLTTQPAETIISIGIPEGAARILRTVKEQHPLMQIFSLLPVEEILPLEAVSDAVIDFAIPDSFAEADRPVNIPEDSVQTLILCALIAAEQSRDSPEQQPFSQISRAIATGLTLLTAHGKTAWGGIRYTLAPYKDPELNMQSYNYLILSPDNTALQSDKQETY